MGGSPKPSNASGPTREASHAANDGQALETARLRPRTRLLVPETVSKVAGLALKRAVLEMHRD